jgi:integrase/recombinase XerD
MANSKPAIQSTRVRGHTGKANSLLNLARQTARLWRKHHLTYDQTKHVVEHVRRELQVEAPKERRRTVDRLDRAEIERLIEAAYEHSSQYGFMVKMLFYTGTRVSEFVHLRVEDLHLALDPPQVYIAQAKGGSDGYVPILPAVAQELRTHLKGRRTGFVFESNRSNHYSTRYVQRLVHSAARRADIDRHVTPHRLRASVATILLDAGMPLDQVQKFLRHKRITTTQIYAETSLHGMSENYIRALTGKR